MPLLSTKAVIFESYYLKLGLLVGVINALKTDKKMPFCPSKLS